MVDDKKKIDPGYKTTEAWLNGGVLAGIGTLLFQLIDSGIITPEHINAASIVAAAKVQGLADGYKALGDTPSTAAIISFAVLKLGALLGLLVTGYKFLKNYTDSRTELKKTSMGYPSTEETAKVARKPKVPKVQQ